MQTSNLEQDTFSSSQSALTYHINSGIKTHPTFSSNTKLKKLAFKQANLCYTWSCSISMFTVVTKYNVNDVRQTRTWLGKTYVSIQKLIALHLSPVIHWVSGIVAM